ncbi:MAG: T9SS type A sorting domain-containing protein [Bacteroidota bacterium]
MKKLLSTLLFLFVITLLSLSAQNRIYPPTLLEPENGDDGQMPDVVLSWAAVGGSGGIVEYEVQLDTNASFPTSQPFPAQDLTGLQMSQLMFGEEYFWRVRSIEGTEMSDWSEVFSFIIFETVTLKTPANNAEKQPPNVQLKCKDRVGSTIITGIDVFEFQADTSENFTSPLLYEGSSETFVTNASYLHFGETYFWRARVSHAADACDWSDTRIFSVISRDTLEDPANNATDMGLENVLTWGGISGVVDYTIEIADNDAFTNAFSLIVEEAEYTTDGLMTFGQEYFWRVRANHATDTSDWTYPFNFTTTSTVHLSSPEDGEMNTTINPLLEWDMVTGVDNFQVQYNNTPNFEEPCCNELIPGADNFFQVVYILDYNTTVYWRARAMKDLDTTSWSDVWEFTTRPIDFGIEESSFGADNISIYPNPSHGKLFIDIAGDENAEVNVYIMDLLGHVHVQQEMMFGMGNTSNTLDLSKLANGLYIIKLNRGDQSYSHKITIHK